MCGNNLSTTVITAVITFILTLTLGVFIGVLLSVRVWKRHCNKELLTSQKYDDNIASSMLTETNPSYTVSQHAEILINNPSQESVRDKKRMSGSCPVPLYEDPDILLQ